jgi:4-hydroxy-tetrahydrodipicolinate reductase
MIKRIAAQPDLELIGVHCYSPEKIGKDTGELVGLAPNGVKATGSIEEIIAAKPDVLTFHGVFPDEDLYVKVLEAGINVVTTADWITGWHRDKNHPHSSGKPVTQLLAEACEKGGATFYGTGMNPGLSPRSNRWMCHVITPRRPGSRSATACRWTIRKSRQSWRSTPASLPTAC